jgi:xylose isomerase
VGERLKIDAATTAFGRCADRFVTGGYHEGHDFLRQLELLAGVEGIVGVALDYPTQYHDPAELRRMLDDVGLELGMTEIDLYSSPRWKYGSLSSPDEDLRREAIETCKRGVEAAIEARGADVQLWLGQDGYDYPFQANLRDAWGRLLDAVAEVAAHRLEMRITVEYKAKEPRTRCHIATVGDALYVCERVGRDNVGITLDVGHSLMAAENPAESAVKAMRDGRLFHLHLNDNYRDWDHDMVLGSVNLWDTLELFYWLAEMDFDGWWGIDIYPYREDGAAALRHTVESIYRFREIAERLRALGLGALQARSDALAILDEVMREVLR